MAIQAEPDVRDAAEVVVTRIVITGGPKTGKTTLALSMRQHPEVCILHTDDLIATHDWSAASQRAAEWLDDPGPWIIEGVAVVRALRKWRAAHPGAAPPIDRVIRLTTPYVALSKGQSTMAKGEDTVWREVAPWLWQHGVPVQMRSGLRCEHPGCDAVVKL